ncbi:hypothetical protein MNBD_GAMMA12-2823 [hydrothermal vent metagenome]|uniref:4Fe-4S ferredoxin-type domain-containing protein n=1 Tax=hydrothermal vent metagenome TaxID=652676 RepID=A0A3B0YZM5_9ZZZZ
MSHSQWDMIIVGAGASGSVFAHEMTRSGFKVLMLEQGKHYKNHNEDFKENELDWLERVWDNSQYQTSGGGFTGAPNFGIGVGGGTLVWTALTPRFFDRDFQLRSLYGQPAGTSVEDWPFKLKNLEPFYDRAEKQMGVSGGVTLWDSPTRTPPPNPAFGYYRSSVLLQRGMQKMGIQSAPGPVAINSKKYRKRDQCVHCGFCRSGCRIDAKYQSDNALLNHSLKTGNLKIHSQALVTKLETSRRHNRVTAVRYRDLATGVEHRAKAKIVVVANNPIEIPRLLLNSANHHFPTGLGNHHDQVGRNFFAHPSTIGVGVMNECVNASIGFNMGNIVTFDFCETADADQQIGGFSFLSMNGAGAGVLAVDPYRDLWGAPLKSTLKNYNKSIFTIAFCEGMPVPENRISVSKVDHDKNGVPVAKIHYQLHQNDQRIFADAVETSKRVLRSAGAQEVHVLDTPFESHAAGTMRMGTHPKNSATNAYGKVHGLRNLFVGGAALFPSGSSVNPTLTLHALALRTTEHIKRHLHDMD